MNKLRQEEPGIGPAGGIILIFILTTAFITLALLLGKALKYLGL